MEVDENGMREEEQLQEDEQGLQAPKDQALSGAQEGYEAAIAERDAQIAELQEQVAEAARNAERADELSAQIAELKEQAAAEREEFALRSAGVRNVKAARALLGDHGGDVAALKEAEPWLFAEPEPRNGKTGLEPKGPAIDADKTLKRWRKLAGLED